MKLEGQLDFKNIFDKPEPPMVEKPKDIETAASLAQKWGDKIIDRIEDKKREKIEEMADWEKDKPSDEYNRYSDIKQREWDARSKKRSPIRKTVLKR